MFKIIVLFWSFLFLFSLSAVTEAVPLRIVSASPCFTEILYALGLEKNVVGVTKYCPNFAGADKKKIVGDMFLNYETIVSLKPDLVIVLPYGNGDNIKMLRAKKMNTLAMRCDTLEDFRKCVLKIASLCSRKELALKLLSDMDGKLEKLKLKVNSIPEASRKKVVVEVWDAPLMISAGHSYISEIIELAGGVNLGDSIDMPAAYVGIEFLYKVNPDVIFMMTLKKPASAWKRLKAVQNNRCYYIDPDEFARPSFKIPDLAWKIYYLTYGRNND